MSQQLLLELRGETLPSMEQFVAGRNTELLETLTAAIAGRAGLRQMHVWGESGSGRTHILQASCIAAGGRYLACAQEQPIDSFEWDSAVPLWGIDDVDSATPAEQAALFTLINEGRGADAGVLVTAANAAPLHLRMLRDDLRTRLAWGLVFRLHALDDVEKDAALTAHAAQLGAALSPEVRHYLLTHFARDMSSLLALLDALDRFALERHRVITVPLVRDWMAEQEGAQ